LTKGSNNLEFLLRAYRVEASSVLPALLVPDYLPLLYFPVPQMRATTHLGASTYPA
jgi:hypothetical protein